MKIRNLLICILLIFASLKVFGQKKTKFGINAGLFYSSIYGFHAPTPIDRSSAIGYSVGLVFEYRLIDKMSLISNLNYDKKVVGYKPWEESEYDFETIISFNYISLPLLLKYDIINNFYINAGPYLGYLINSIYKWGGHYSDNSVFTKKIDIGLTTSIGYLFLLDKNTLTFELRNNLGLINTSRYPVIDDGTNKNHSIGIVLGFLF